MEERLIVREFVVFNAVVLVSASAAETTLRVLEPASPCFFVFFTPSRGGLEVPCSSESRPGGLTLPLRTSEDGRFCF